MPYLKMFNNNRSFETKYCLHCLDKHPTIDKLKKINPLIIRFCANDFSTFIKQYLYVRSIFYQNILIKIKMLLLIYIHTREKKNR